MREVWRCHRICMCFPLQVLAVVEDRSRVLSLHPTLLDTIETGQQCLCSDCLFNILVVFIYLYICVAIWICTAVLSVYCVHCCVFMLRGFRLRWRNQWEVDRWGPAALSYGGAHRPSLQVWNQRSLWFCLNIKSSCYSEGKEPKISILHSVILPVNTM